MNSVPSRQEATAAPALVDIGEGWRVFESGAVTLRMKGWIAGPGGETLARDLDRADGPPTADRLAQGLRATDGHFALIATGPGWAFAAVDRVRSIPLAFARVNGAWTIGDCPGRLRRRAGLGRDRIDPDAWLAIAMAGYTVDTATLYRGLEVPGPGEMILFGDGEPVRTRWYIYRPWRLGDFDPRTAGEALADRLLAVMQKTLDSLDGRPLVIPLSAGLDSRFVASAARHLGYRDIRCFSYGRPDNFEAVAAAEIARRLGCPWRFVPASVRGHARFFAGDEYDRYLDQADSCVSTPFVQDMPAILALKADGFIPAEAVMANGNSGDYISGAHIPPNLRTPPVGLAPEARWSRILDTIYDKHFALWGALRTPETRERIRALLRASIDRAGGTLGEPEADHGLYEYAEFQDRQCKYVISGQRIYEFLGHEWRLPLWDNGLLDFWEGVPLVAKAGQALYADTLAKTNWGGVWRDIPVNRKTVRPRWLVPLRLAAKAAHAPLGRARWHRFERRYLQYWMDASGNSACIPWRRAASDGRQARHAVSWLAEQYLARHDLPLAA